MLPEKLGSLPSAPIDWPVELGEWETPPVVPPLAPGATGLAVPA